jgi:hypothetical protein
VKVRRVVDEEVDAVVRADEPGRLPADARPDDIDRDAVAALREGAAGVRCECNRLRADVRCRDRIRDAVAAHSRRMSRDAGPRHRRRACRGADGHRQVSAARVRFARVGGVNVIFARELLRGAERGDAVHQRQRRRELRDHPCSACDRGRVVIGCSLRHQRRSPLRCVKCSACCNRVRVDFRAIDLAVVASSDVADDVSLGGVVVGQACAAKVAHGVRAKVEHPVEALTRRRRRAQRPARLDLCVRRLHDVSRRRGCFRPCGKHRGLSDCHRLELRLKVESLRACREQRRRLALLLRTANR